LQDDVLVGLQVVADGEPGDQLGVYAAAGHGFDVCDVGGRLRECRVSAQPVQLAVAAPLVFPVDGHLDHLRAGGSLRAGSGGEVLEVLGHAGQAHRLEPVQGLHVDHGCPSSPV
jgi:hypothetical protein